ncbi:glycosyltransferase family 4 protein [Micromonospora orduensis]|uniref:Glycosyltransferase family 4 protein n=1 Tax=Micromonospora orduensis TaxID=1420891 RepID=A0A5C4QLC9_9ACTN|nr:glycosyltransferase family 4 protein [Micromonospora orduensis]
MGEPTTTTDLIPALRSTATPQVLAMAAYRFPHGDAMSNRLLQLARSATPPGGTALVVNDWPQDGSRPPDNPELPPGVRLITLPPQRVSGGIAGRWLHRYTRPLRVLAALRRAGVRPGALAGVHLPLSLWNFTTWAVLRTAVRCPVTVDVLERHDRAQFPRGWLTPYFVRHRWAFFLAGRLADRVVAISETLERYFVGRGRPTLVVPPQVDCADYADPAPPSLTDGLRLLYAGSAGAKDQLAVVLDGIRRLAPEDRSRVRLVIAGISREHADTLSDLDATSPEDLYDQVIFLGRVPRDRVLAELGRAHFSVLVRPPVGYAQAGFPSKVPESLAAGCPVLLNHTSDLRRYIVDGREGIVLDGAGPDDIRRGLERALLLDDPEWRSMSRAARERAHCFDYRAWTAAVSDFVTGAVRAPGDGSSARPASSAEVSRRWGG